MRLVYVISRYTSSSSNYRLHLPDDRGLPLCGAKSFSVEWVETARPTCKKCLKLIRNPIKHCYDCGTAFYALSSTHYCPRCRGVSYKIVRNPTMKKINEELLLDKITYLMSLPTASNPPNRMSSQLDEMASQTEREEAWKKGMVL